MIFFSDGTNWEKSKEVEMATYDNTHCIRLTPDKKNTTGRVWNTKALDETFTIKSASKVIGDYVWEQHFTIRIHNTHKNGGADGFAFWYTKKPILREGNVFGAENMWDGLMVAIDTFDNDGDRDEPLIYAILNDGSITYNPNTDGKPFISGSCKLNFQQTNKLTISVSYNRAKRTLEVFYNNNNIIYYLFIYCLIIIIFEQRY